MECIDWKRKNEEKQFNFFYISTKFVYLSIRIWAEENIGKLVYEKRNELFSKSPN